MGQCLELPIAVAIPKPGQQRRHGSGQPQDLPSDGRAEDHRQAETSPEDAQEMIFHGG
jgi:hypothetical protein